ncbi:hypothetical protein D0863_14387 [Hortaea werneckii]|uniref:Opi1-domain-containing protein n=1 Tax=Hortaea werneckii TaxID=91943 RepID=A0A3M7CIX9_HORWE|nr:hypothetical protein D0863_14387 [Hortaea werneckii]
MEVERPKPPEYASHRPENVHLPDAPTHAPIQPGGGGGVTLPDLKTVLSPQYQATTPPPGSHPVPPGSPAQSVRSIPRIETQRQSNGTNSSKETAAFSPSEAGSLQGTDDGKRMKSGLSVDDSDVRDAAEALAVLGNSGYARSTPPDGSGNHMQTPQHVGPSSAELAQDHHQAQEPLFYLFQQAHPVIGGTIQGSINAYSTTKGFAPRFVQASADLLERNIASPVITTVGNVGRLTGLESAARWYYTPRQAPENEQEEARGGRNKRRRVMDEESAMDIDSTAPVSPRSHHARRESAESSMESLPAYRASKPPSYREEASPAALDRSQRPERPPNPRTWSQQIFFTTSGLGVAMSERSRGSLHYCIGILNRSAEHISTVAKALQLVLDQYDQARLHYHQQRASAAEKGEQRPQTPDQDEAARHLAAIIKQHCDDIWQTLKGVVHSVSVTVGGALPLNAREFVRRQLMSLPGRWRRVSDNQRSESETSRMATRMIDFAREGLDMIDQVGQTCQSTLESAEGWMNMVGRGGGNGTGRPAGGGVEYAGSDGYPVYKQPMEVEQEARAQEQEKQ